jgi:hypothetical protein
MKLISDVTKKTWKRVDEQRDNPFFLEILFCFKDNENLPVSFNNLSFGASVLEKENVIYTFSEPQENFSYEYTDQEFIFSISLENFELEKEYILNAWSINNEEKWEDSFIIKFSEPPLEFYEEN